MRSIISKIALSAAAALALQACGPKADEPQPLKISIFGEHIESIAHQQHISFKEAAQKVYDMGYRGVDVSNTIKPENMKILDEIGFEHAAIHAHVYFSDGEQEELAAQTISFMVENHFEKVLLVPGFLSDQPTDEEWETIIQRTAEFTKKAKAAGLDVCLEDYDHRNSPTYNTTRLDKMFERLPELNFVFDSGNFAFAGDAILPALEHFMPRVHHAHLKDRLAYGDAHLPATAVGGGILPIREAVKRLVENGYDGWFTVEFFGSRRTLEDAEFSIRTLRGDFD